MNSGEMPQPALDAIAGDRVSECSTDDETDSRTRPAHRIVLGREIVRSMRGMHDECGPARSKPPPGRQAEIFRVVHSQQSRQHRGRGPTESGGQAGAALAAPGGNDGAAGPGPHPQTKAVGTAATPVARLECALTHGKTPTIFGVLDNQVRRSPGTHRKGGAGRWQSSL